MKSYVEFVLQYEAVFGKQLKVAQDLAFLLDDPCMEFREGGRMRFTVKNGFALRIRVLEQLHGLCAELNINPPPWEIEPFDALSPSVKDEEGLASEVERLVVPASVLIHRLPPSEDRERAIHLIKTLDLLPTLLSEWSRPDRTETLAVLNRLLLSANSPIIRIFPAEKFAFRDQQILTECDVRVAIVDDDQNEIIKSWLALIGCPKLSIQSVIVRFDDCNDDRELQIRETAKRVLACKPDIVLMDQGMPPVSGSDVIRAVRKLDETEEIVFVGNTGGGPEELERAGAVGNFVKGSNLAIMRTVLNRFS